MKRYRVAVVGCSRMGGFIDDEVADRSPWMLPYSHAAGYMAVERTELIACADVRQEAADRFGERYGVPPEGRYTDYRALIEKEKPDILSIATQPEHRAEIAIYACQNGVRALYCEKPLSASLEEADRIEAAVKTHGVFLNMGTNRRWDIGFNRMRDIVQSGDLGALKSVVIYNGSSLFNTGSHWFDLALMLAGDSPPRWAQASIVEPKSELFDGELIKADPVCHGMIGLENGVTVYVLLTPRKAEHEAVCERGTVTAMNSREGWELRVIDAESDGRMDRRPYPEVSRDSSTKRLIEDLVHALDTGEPTRGGIEVARCNMEMIMGCIESHRRGGARVELPLVDRSLRLARDVRPKKVMSERVS